MDRPRLLESSVNLRRVLSEAAAVGLASSSSFLAFEHGTTRREVDRPRSRPKSAVTPSPREIVSREDASGQRRSRNGEAVAFGQKVRRILHDRREGCGSSRR